MKITIMRIRSLCPFLLVILLVGVAWPAPAGESAPEQEQEQEQEAEAEEAAREPSLDERLDALLQETVSADEYRETANCLRQQDYRSVDILNQEYLLFRKGSTYWLNRLRHRCVSLHRTMLLTFEKRGTTRICAGDPFYVSDRLDFDRGFSPTGRPLASHGTCFLGTFESITAEQAVLLRDLR